MLGGNQGSLFYGDVSVMAILDVCLPFSIVCFVLLLNFLVNNYRHVETSTFPKYIVKSKKYAKTRNSSNQKPNPALKTKTGNN